MGQTMAVGAASCDPQGPGQGSEPETQCGPAPPSPDPQCGGCRLTCLESFHLTKYSHNSALSEMKVCLCPTFLVLVHSKCSPGLENVSHSRPNFSDTYDVVNFKAAEHDPLIPHFVSLCNIDVELPRWESKWQRTCLPMQEM